MKDIRDRLTFLLLKKNKSKTERRELRHYLSIGLYKTNRINGIPDFLIRKKMRHLVSN